MVNSVDPNTNNPEDVLIDIKTVFGFHKPTPFNILSNPLIIHQKVIGDKNKDIIIQIFEKGTDAHFRLHMLKEIK